MVCDEYNNNRFELAHHGTHSPLNVCFSGCTTNTSETRVKAESTILLSSPVNLCMRTIVWSYSVTNNESSNTSSLKGRAAEKRGWQTFSNC